MFLFILLVLCATCISLSFYFLLRGALFKPKDQILRLQVTARRNVASDLMTICLQRLWWLRWLPLPRYLAGQSVSVALPKNPKLRRRYSLARWSFYAFAYELSIKREEQGQLSKQLYEHANVGQMLNITRPSGDFVLRQTSDPNSKLVLLSGGIGITPLLSMIEACIFKKHGFKQVVLFWQTRYENEWIYQDLISHYKQKYSWLSVHCLASRENLMQRVDISLIKQEVKNLHNAQYYICAGNSLQNMFLHHLAIEGVPKNQIHYERFSIGSATEAGVYALNIDQHQPIKFNQHSHLLDALENANFEISADCRTGSCGQCRLRLQSGSVRYLISPEFAVPNGQVLTCCAIPCEDLKLALL